MIESHSQTSLKGGARLTKCHTVRRLKLAGSSGLTGWIFQSKVNTTANDL